MRQAGHGFSHHRGNEVTRALTPNFTETEIYQNLEQHRNIECNSLTNCDIRNQKHSDGVKDSRHVDSDDEITNVEPKLPDVDHFFNSEFRSNEQAKNA